MLEEVGLLEEIERMRKEAESFSVEDEKKKSLVELKNSAEQLIYTAEKALKDNGDKVDPTIKTGVEDKIAEVRKVKESDEATLKVAVEALSTELSKIGEALYKQQNNTPAAPETTKEEGPTEAGNPDETK